MNQEGIIVKGIAGFYYVKLEDGRNIECKARGKFRKEKLSPIVGDMVTLEVTEDGKGTIEDIIPRRTQLIRPLVANVDQAIIVFALKKPEINLNLLDKLLILTEHSGLDTIVCLNKGDLDDENSYDGISKLYRNIGYKVIRTNGLTGEGIEKLKELVKGKISVFVGPSGVGKSTIFNKLQDKIRMVTGDISAKIDRGKHTTRHAELIEIDSDTYIVDTPGFSSLDLGFLSPEDLQYVFKEFNDFIGQCRFTSCVHNKETGCKIKNEVENGTINQSRYNTYIELLEELQKNCRRNRK